MRFQPAAQLLTLLLFAMLPSVARAQQPLVRGTWILNQQQSDDVGSRMNGALAQMNVVARQIARPRMRRTNIVYPHLMIAYDSENVRLDMEGSPPLSSPTNSEPVLWQRDTGARCAAVRGECVRVTSTWKRDRLEQMFVAENGERLNVFTVSPDGRTLTMNVTLTSQHLPIPLTYRLIYDRAPDGDESR